MYFVFDLHIRRFGMRSPPLFHVCQDLDTLFSPGLFVHLWSFSFRCLPDGSTLPLPFYLDNSLCKNPWHTPLVVGAWSASRSPCDWAMAPRKLPIRLRS